MTQTMEFVSFRWPQNPTTLSVAHTRQVQEQLLPYHGTAIQDLGKRGLVITGEGVFRGASAETQFACLRRYYDEGTVGVLRLMGMPPVMAKLIKLELVGKFEPDKLGYRFTFWEDSSVPLPPERPKAIHRTCTVKEGDTLWHIANQYDTTVEILLLENPDIQWPNALTAGRQVVLP